MLLGFLCFQAAPVYRFILNKESSLSSSDADSGLHPNCYRRFAKQNPDETNTHGRLSHRRMPLDFHKVNQLAITKPARV